MLLTCTQISAHEARLRLTGTEMLQGGPGEREIRESYEESEALLASAVPHRSTPPLKSAPEASATVASASGSMPASGSTPASGSMPATAQKSTLNLPPSLISPPGASSTAAHTVPGVSCAAEEHAERQQLQQAAAITSGEVYGVCVCVCVCVFN